MSLKSGKYFFDNMFSTLWTQTPIHYAGCEFDAEGMAQWVNPVYTPSRQEKASLSNKVTRTYANIYIPCWADNDVDVMGLMDDVIDFIETNTVSPYKINSVQVIDHGFDDSNKVFGIIMVGIEHISGDCTVSSRTARNVVNQATDVYNNAVQTVN